MKLLHLSDLHIGKKLGLNSLIEDQQYMLKQILKCIDQQNIDIVLIAGDVYDKSIPSTQAISLFDDFLYDLVKRKLKVIIISGNHDSAQRLAFTNRLLNTNGIYIANEYKGKVECVTLEDDYGEVNFYLLPFIKPIYVSYYNEVEIKNNSYNDALEYVINQIQLDQTKRNIILSHQFVTGSSKGGSELISVGGLDNVDATLYKDFDYVALGHIHRFQKITDKIYYCGTTMKYDFSEENQQKVLQIIEIKDKNHLEVSQYKIECLRNFINLKGYFNDLINLSNMSNIKSNDFVHITLLDEQEIVNAFELLSKKYKGLQSIDYDNKRTRHQQENGNTMANVSLTPLELIDEFYLSQNGSHLLDEQKKYLTALLDEVWEEKA